jgi:putative Holliday junction resolvase
MRYLGLDLGTRSCGIAITDKTNTICTPKSPIFFNHEEYDKLLEELKPMIEENEITDVVIGLPKNMDGSMGFAAERSINFANLLKELNVKVHFIDERLTSVEALSVLHFTGKTAKDGKKVIDSVSANIILDTYLRSLKNEKQDDSQA